MPSMCQTIVNKMVGGTGFRNRMVENGSNTRRKNEAERGGGGERKRKREGRQQE